MTAWGVKKDVGTGAPAETAAAASDSELVSRCQNGQVSAFEQLMERYQDRLFNLVFRLTGHYQDAQDVTQEAFLRAFEHIGQFRQKAQVYTWLFRIAVNLAISQRRRGRRARLVPLDGPAGGDGQSGDSPSLAERLTNVKAEPPEAAARRDEQSELVQRAIGELDDQARAVVLLKEIEGFDYRQIADILELPLGTVKSRLHRARLELRGRLEPAARTLDEP